MPAGRLERPSLRQPAATAPEETMMNSRSPPWRAPLSATRRSIRGRLRPSAVVRTALPALSTTLLVLLRNCCRLKVMAVKAELLPDGVAQGLDPQVGGRGDQQAAPAGRRVGLEHLLPGKIRRQ